MAQGTVVSITQHERWRRGALGVIDFLSVLSTDAEVWQNDGRDWVVGAMPDPDDGEYEMIGTVADILVDYLEATS
jgi:hypothetical protein